MKTCRECGKEGYTSALGMCEGCFDKEYARYTEARAVFLKVGDRVEVLIGTRNPTYGAICTIDPTRPYPIEVALDPEPRQTKGDRFWFTAADLRKVIPGITFLNKEMAELQALFDVSCKPLRAERDRLLNENERLRDELRIAHSIIKSNTAELSTLKTERDILRRTENVHLNRTLAAYQAEIVGLKHILKVKQKEADNEIDGLRQRLANHHKECLEYPRLVDVEEISRLRAELEKAEALQNEKTPTVEVFLMNLPSIIGAEQHEFIADMRKARSKGVGYGWMQQMIEIEWNANHPVGAWGPRYFHDRIERLFASARETQDQLLLRNTEIGEENARLQRMLVYVQASVTEHAERIARLLAVKEEP